MIVVLTGGTGRIQQGLRLLNQHIAPQLFISGVTKKETVPQLLKRFRASTHFPSVAPQMVTLGFNAETTKGNAREIHHWVEKTWTFQKRAPRIVLVTSVYHIPRSLHEIQRLVPNASLIAYPVFAKDFAEESWSTSLDTWRLIVSEYIKFIIVYCYHSLSS